MTVSGESPQSAILISRFAAPVFAAENPRVRKTLISLSPIAAFLARYIHLIALAIFAIVGFAIHDDYGFMSDEDHQRGMGNASLDYILGDENALIEDHVDRYYGVALEVPLVVAERVFRLEDSRDMYLSRRLLAHSFFLAGGFFAWLLAYRLFGNRLIALFAMSLFLLHPRMYAHSFFNTKDPAFLSMFMVALYLIHRAFRRNSVWAFALCGAGVGLLMNIRVIGAMLVPAVLGMLTLDALFAVKPGWFGGRAGARRAADSQAAGASGQRGERRRRRLQARRERERERERSAGARRAAANAAAFAAMSAITLYASWPLLSSDPTELMEAFRVMSRHPTHAPTLFRGDWIRWPNIPWDYVPAWALASTPLAALALIALGIVRVARLCAAPRGAALRNSAARFGLLMVACAVLPPAAAIALNSNLYGDWRQMYFLYAPMCVLAAFGLSALPERRLRIGAFALPARRLKIGAFALTAVGIASAIIQMVQLHPLQYNYFNALVNKNGVADRWVINYPDVLHKKALDALLAMRPSGRIDVAPSGSAYSIESNKKLLPPDERGRLVTAMSFPSFRIVQGDGAEGALWSRDVYGVPILAIQDVRAESESAFRDAYAAASASEPAIAAGGFNIYKDGGRLIWVKRQCSEYDTRGRFALSVYPIDLADLPQIARDEGLERERLNFDFANHGAILDGVCVIIRELPDYPISHVAIGQWIPGDPGALWNGEIAVDGR